MDGVLKKRKMTKERWTKIAEKSKRSPVRFLHLHRQDTCQTHIPLRRTPRQTLRPRSPSDDILQGAISSFSIICAKLGIRTPLTLCLLMYLRLLSKKTLICTVASSEVPAIFPSSGGVSLRTKTLVCVAISLTASVRRMVRIS